MNYQQIIRRSSLGFVLREISIQLITGWVGNAKEKYDVPGIDSIGFDAQAVEENLVTHLASAIETLKNEKSHEKKFTPGWSFGFLCGHVQGALNVKWSNQYLIETSNDFKDLMKLRTILEIITLDSDLSKKIEIVYEYYLKSGEQIAKEDEPMPANVVPLVQTGKLQSKNAEMYRNEFKKYFKKLLVAEYLYLLRTYDRMCCPNLTNYLNEREILDIVGSEHFA